MRYRMALASAATLTFVAGAAVLASADTAGGPTDEASVVRIKLEDFKKDFDAGKLVLLDVRGAETYSSGHIPGALSFPLSGLEQRASELAALKKPIVTYCA